VCWPVALKKIPFGRVIIGPRVCDSKDPFIIVVASEEGAPASPEIIDVGIFADRR
jgi:hypothetical protein